MPIQFEWDEDKNAANEREHGVSFEEASSVFFDEKGLLIHDPDHSDAEDRYLLMGMTEKLRVLIVSHTYRDSDRVIRLISARKASRNERQQYERQKL